MAARDDAGGMMTKVWGPAAWLFLHCITFNYPDINPIGASYTDLLRAERLKRDYYNFFYYLGKVLPCEQCRQSYQHFWNQSPLHQNLASRADLTKWLYEIHNKVCDKLTSNGGVRASQITYEELVAKYMSFRTTCESAGAVAPRASSEASESAGASCSAQINGKTNKTCINIVNGDTPDVLVLNRTQCMRLCWIIGAIGLLMCILVICV
jgi:hypothetical protein